MQTTGDKTAPPSSSPTATDHRPGGGAPTTATELGRHYGEHGRPATTSAGPPAHDSAHDSARQDAPRGGEQADSAMAKITETAQDVANRAREQAGPAVQAVYDQGARAGQYVTHNVHQYPASAMLVAAAVGYGLAYLIHGGGRSLRWGRHEFHNRHDWQAH